MSDMAGGSSTDALAAARPISGTSGIQVDDALSFSTNGIHKLSHGYSQHPMLSLGRLQRLAESLYGAGQCRFMPASWTRSEPFVLDRESHDGRGIAQIFGEMEVAGSWIAIYNVEADPEYRRLLWDVMAGLTHLLEPGEEVFDVRGFIFVSAPPSLTPFHIDRENNFWLQVQGRKRMYVWSHMDREVVAAPDIEDFIVHRTLTRVLWRDSFRDRCIEFDCGPGDGVFFPSTTPHMTQSEPDWVRPGDGVSVSIGVNFYTNHTRRAAHIHNLNRVLRKLHLVPRFPGESPLLDGLKYPVARGLFEYQKLFRGFKSPPGF